MLFYFYGVLLMNMIYVYDVRFQGFCLSYDFNWM